MLNLGPPLNAWRLWHRTRTCNLPSAVSGMSIPVPSSHGCSGSLTVWAAWCEPGGRRLAGDSVCGPGRGVGDHELELAAGSAGELLAALDRDLWVLHAKREELLGDGLAKAGLQWVIAGYRRVAGDDADAQDRAVLDDLELADLGVAGEQGELEGVDGDPAAVTGRKGEDVVAA